MAQVSQSENRTGKETPMVLASKMGRRSFIVAATTALGLGAEQREYGPGAPPIRYPDPDIVVFDEQIAAIDPLYEEEIFR